MTPQGSFDEFVKESTKRSSAGTGASSLYGSSSTLLVFGILLFAAAYLIWSSYSPKYVFRSDEERVKFFAEVREDPSKRVVLMVTDWCPACRNLEGLLQKRAVPYVRLNIEQSVPGRRLYDSLVQKTGQRSIPQVVVDRVWVGSSYGGMVEALAAK
jgi:glutaredoxin